MTVAVEPEPDLAASGAAASAAAGETEPAAGVAAARCLMVTYQDSAGISRVKTVPTRKLARIAEVGCTASISAAALFSTDDYPVSTSALDATVGDLRVIPDLTAAAPIDRDGGLWWAPATLHELDGSPFAGCQRSVLRRVADDLRAAGFEPVIGMELEFTLFAGTKDDPRPAHVGPGYSTLAFLELEAFCRDLLAALAASAVAVEQLHPEYGRGQMEVSLAPSDPVHAVDEYLLTRLVVTRVALAHGHHVSFAPVTMLGGASNGLHIHMSATTDDGANVFHVDGDVATMPTAGKRMLAGVVEHLVAATALLTGSTISFQRLRPHMWSGAYACWGDGNREAAVRLMRGFGAGAAKQANIEIKCADATSNQYLAVAAVLASALDGVRNAAVLPPEITVDPDSLSDDQRAAAGVRRLPADLPAALDALAASELFRSVLGEILFDAYLTVRRHDHEVYGALAADDPAALIASARWRQ